jgi:hypothetical protein
MDEEILRLLYQAFDPAKPATKEEYVDTFEARGSQSLADYFIRRLLRSKDVGRISYLFSGHIGSGKSSELLHLARCLRSGHTKLGGKRYLPIYLDIQDYVDLFDVDVSDVLLAIVSEIGHQFRTDPELNFEELTDVRFMARLKDLWDRLPNTADLQSLAVSLGNAKAKIALLRQDPKRRREIREALNLEPSRFREEVNSVIQAARIVARAKGFEDIVLLVDTLDKIQRTSKESDPLKAHVELFVTNATSFTELSVHKVLTCNLSLARAHPMELGLRYGKEIFVMPLVKVETRTHEPYAAGIQSFRHLVSGRLRGIRGLEIEGTFDEEALQYLTKYAGGHPRKFTMFLNEAIAEADALPIGLEEAKKAVRPTVAMLIPSIRTKWWAKLAALELDPGRQVDEEDPDVQLMLDETVICEYRNGDDEASEFEESAPWYAVNPILRETRSFQTALEEAAKANAEPADSGS